ncbi:MAG: site-2 protease family protein [Acidobacteriota bacterium]|nr:site-2 protease family protein [Acidobacteriota bacterium]
MPEPGFISKIDSVEQSPTVLNSSRRPLQWAIHALLFLATFLTTTAFGSALADSFSRQRPLNIDSVVDCYVRLAHLDRAIWQGLCFSLPLLAILLAHELGHYLECRRRGVDASLPYFLPSPSLFGTFGAFIRIRSPIYSREGLFDIGIGGPLAGFIVLLPFLIAGAMLSKTTSAPVPADSIIFGTPLLLRLVEVFRFPLTPAPRILLHPTAISAWAGLFATALNLLPIGQLDGGHILYALGAEQWHKRVGFGFVFLLAIAGFLYWPWWIWGGVMFLFGRRHPLVYDNTPLSTGRVFLCVAALIIFVLSATIVPVRSF